MSGHGAVFDPAELAALEGLDFRARYLVEGYLSGLHRSPFQGSSVEFSEYKDYMPGDDLRRVDWKLYARRDRLYTRRFEHDSEARCCILCDQSASMAYRGPRAWASKAACARTIALAIASLLLGQRDPVGLLALTDGTETGRSLTYLAPSHKPGRIGELLRALNSMPIHGGPQLPELLGHALRLIRQRSIVLIFSDLLDPAGELEEALKHLRFNGSEIVVFQVLDPDEIEFPFTADGVFADPETGEKRQVQPAAARAAYLARFTAFMEEHRRLFERVEASHRLFRTDENPGPALAAFLGARRTR